MQPDILGPLRVSLDDRILELKIVSKQEVGDDHLDGVGREEAPRAGKLAVPEMQVRAARGGELMSVALAGPLAVAVMSEAVKTHGVGDVGLVDDDWVYRHHEMGILRQHGAVRESQRFAHTAFEADFYPVQNVQRRRSWRRSWKDGGGVGAYGDWGGSNAAIRA